MGDSFQSFVLPETGAENAKLVAAQISGWLIAQGIVNEGRTISLEGVAGFEPGPNVEHALASQQPGWQDVAFKDIHVDSNRCVRTAVQGGLGPVFCPACESPMGSPEDMPPSFTHAVEQWHGGREGTLTCPACESSAPVTKWRTEPFWAFGNVTVTFWNWPPIRDAFVHEVEAATGQPVKVVRGRI